MLLDFQEPKTKNTDCKFERKNTRAAEPENQMDNSASTSPVVLGIEMAKKAIDYDNGRMYVQSIMCYDLAVDYFNRALPGKLLKI